MTEYLSCTYKYKSLNNLCNAKVNSYAKKNDMKEK